MIVIETYEAEAKEKESTSKLSRSGSIHFKIGHTTLLPSSLYINDLKKSWACLYSLMEQDHCEIDIGYGKTVICQIRTGKIGVQLEVNRVDQRGVPIRLLSGYVDKQELFRALQDAYDKFNNQSTQKRIQPLNRHSTQIL
ncbi:hypothetical protein [Alkalicoccobacillus murimartini]|uniref:Uncharacterized protein n=1 Tax=Alkalicoccobacillus murimartini TaxID=171685 RepID=A0ABT9YEH4_9BACI|nr:hypothetical protein [Alkalicoccobacillus murimartini]MDQ0206124.1 hypothetical protein [Alkalicoccobacillus murimartini]